MPPTPRPRSATAEVPHLHLLSDEREAPPQPGEPFLLHGSFCRNTAEVREMDAAFRRGDPVVFYEFMQGMVDYGRHHTPPPRIVLEYQSGKRVEFNGKSFEMPEEDPIVALEFTNHGPGLAPSDTVIASHMADRDDTLGRHGRGTTVALTFLATQGMTTTIHSNYQGRRWDAKTHLRDSDDGKHEDILYVEGQYDGAADVRRSTFRVENPDPRLVAQLKGIPNFFLYANPRFPEAILVPCEEGEVSEPHKVGVGGGEVMCLEGIVEPIKDEGYWKHVFVDGLRVRVPYHQMALPWSVQGLSNPQNDEFKVARSKDSSSVESYNLAKVIGCAVRTLTDEKLWKKIIETTLAHRCAEPLELKAMNSFSGQPLPTATAETIRKLWETDYANVVITDSEYRLSRFHKQHPDTRVCWIPNAGLYSLLKQVGIKTLDQVAGLSEKVTIDAYHSLHMPEALGPQAVESLLERVAMERGDVETFQLKGKSYLKIRLPWTIENAAQLKREFRGESTNRSARLIELTAVIAHVKEMGFEAFSVNGDLFYQIHARPEKGYDEDSFRVSVDVEQYPRDRFPDYASFEEDGTYLLLAAEDFQNPTRLQALVAFFLKIAEEIQARLKRLPARKGAPLRRRGKGLAEEAEEDVTSRAPQAHVIAKTSVGQIRTDKAPEKKETSEEPWVTASGETIESITPPGYYRKQVCTALTFKDKAVQWEGLERLAEVDVFRGQPREISSQIVLHNVNTDYERLDVRAGEKIVAFQTDPKNAKIRFFRDVRTGIYVMTGKVRHVVYYLQPEDDVSYVHHKPTPDEAEDVVESSYLLPHWKTFIDEMRGNPGLSTFVKVQQAMKHWREHFCYAADFSLNDQNSGESRGEIAAKILNTSRGICNVSATGLAVLLRAIGIPSRVCSGYWVQSAEHHGTHLWVEYWDNNQWVPLESQVGVDSSEELVDQKRPQIMALLGEPGSEEGKRSVQGLFAAVSAIIRANLEEAGFSVFKKDDVTKLAAEMIQLRSARQRTQTWIRRAILLGVLAGAGGAYWLHKTNADQPQVNACHQVCE